MKSMTLKEAEVILDIVSAALQATPIYGVHPKSLLKGYGLHEIDAALKLRIAELFLFYSNRNDITGFDKSVRDISGIPLHIAMFVDDSEIQKVTDLTEGSEEFSKQKWHLQGLTILRDNDGTIKNKDLATLERPSSFSDFCKSLSTTDPDFWPKIYGRIGLVYQEQPAATISKNEEKNSGAWFYLASTTIGLMLLWTGSSWVKVAAIFLLLPIIQLIAKKGTTGIAWLIKSQLKD